MIVLIGSLNPSKIEAVKIAFETLGFREVEFIGADAKSGVPSKPIGFEILRGCENRNKCLKEYAKVNGIKYDYLCSVEGGFSLDENGLPFVVTYAIVENAKGKESTGKSLGIRLNREMYRYVRDGKSLNVVIEGLTKSENNKQGQGITGYLSNGVLSRNNVDVDAVVTALIPLVFEEKYKALTEKL